MAASLRNFIITFILALLLFGGLAYSYYPDLEALLPFGEKEVSEETSGSMSNDTSMPSFVLPPVEDGDGLGAISGLIVTQNADGKVTKAQFLRINSENLRIITCDLSLQATLYNQVGALVPLEDYLRLYPMIQSSQAIRALTGYPADFYLVFKPDSVRTLASNLEGATFPLRQQIRYPNPVYNGVKFEEGEPLPLDYYIEIIIGTDLFSGDTLSTVFGPYAEAYHNEELAGKVQGPDPNALLAELYDYLIGLLNGRQNDAMRGDLNRLADALSGGDTNLTAAYLNEHAELLFKYGDTKYQRVNVPFTTRDSTLHNIKQEDSK